MRWRIGLCILLPFLLFIAIVESMEYYHNWGVRNAPEVQGQVIKRETISSLNGFRNTGRMTVRIADSNVEVIAATNSTDLKELPDMVRFRYGGDPSREVFIEGEEDPFWVSLILWAGSFAIIWFCLRPLITGEAVAPKRAYHRDIPNISPR